MCRFCGFDRLRMWVFKKMRFIFMEEQSKKKMGRPKKLTSNTVPIHTKISTFDNEILKEACDILRVKSSEFIRTAITDKARKIVIENTIKDDKPEVRSDLKSAKKEAEDEGPMVRDWSIYEDDDLE